MARITLICGSLMSERSSRIDALWREHGNAAILLTPTVRLARARESLFLRRYDLPGFWGSHALELKAFACEIVKSSGRHVRMLSTLERQLMVRQALEDMAGGGENMPPDTTPGLVRHLLRVITELKQAAVEPEAFRGAVMKSKRKGVFDPLVAAVYEHYQAALVAQERYDVPGLYWEAERCCRRIAVELPNQADILLLDGFDDFTLSQQRFLAALSERVSRMVIGLHYDADPDRGDLFQLQQRWVDKFTAALPVEVQYVAAAPPKTYVEHIGRHLFWRNPPPSPAGLRANARIIPCADAQHEMESIARQVKRLIVRENVAPRNIAVCLADMQLMTDAVQAVFTGFGIPVVMRTTPLLSATATGAFIMRLFEAMDTWERIPVVTLLASPLFDMYFGDKEPGAANAPTDSASGNALCSQAAGYEKAFSLLSRLAGVVMGRAEWEKGLARLEKLVANDNLRERSGFNIPEPAAAVAAFKKRLSALAAFADEMPGQGTFECFARFLGERLAISKPGTNIPPFDDEAMQIRETAAMRAVFALFEQVAVMPLLNETVSRAEFIRFMGDAMRETRIPMQNARGGGVCCCGLDGLRHEQVDYVFLGGLNEGVLPRPAPINAVYSEADKKRLNLDLPGRWEHTHRERLLFCHAINAAQQELTLSWRKQDATGRDALPSPFVADIHDLFQEHNITISEPEPGPECFLPDPLLAASKRDVANIACHRNSRVLREYIAADARALDRAVSIETRRNSGGAFDIYDGCIAAPDLLDVLAKRYGEAAQFSVNQIETYLKLPFHFFMERVLGIAETIVPETELDARTRGSIMHDALYRFHKHFSGASVAELLALDEKGTRTFMQNSAHAAFRHHERHLLSVPDVVLQVERRRLEAALDRYISRAAEDFGREIAPRYFEAVFGRAPRDAEEDLYVQEPFPLVVDGETFRLTGKIDRIDMDDATARIVDYKSSTLPARKDITEGVDLQLTVYAWALENLLLPGINCQEAFYYSVYKTEKREALLRGKEEDFAQREDNARRRIAEAVRGIRGGQFPPLPDASTDRRRNAPHTAARYEEWRIGRKCPERHAAHAQTDATDDELNGDAQ